VNGSYVTTITDSLNNSVQYTNTITSIGNTEITLNLALPSVLRKQCNPSYHTITTYHIIQHHHLSLILVI
jgi:hypothetical protein